MSNLTHIRRRRGIDGPVVVVTCTACDERTVFAADEGNLAASYRERHLQTHHVPATGFMSCGLCGETIPDVLPMPGEDARQAMSAEQRRTRHLAVTALMRHGRKHGYQVTA